MISIKFFFIYVNAKAGKTDGGQHLFSDPHALLFWSEYAKCTGKRNGKWEKRDDQLKEHTGESRMVLLDGWWIKNECVHFR